MNKKLPIVAILLLLIIFIAGCGDDSSSGSSPGDTSGSGSSSISTSATSEPKTLSATVFQNDDTGTITVTNKDAFAYQHFSVHLNMPDGISLDQGYVLETNDLPAGQATTLNVADFAKEDGTRFQSSSTKIVNISLETMDEKGNLTGMASYKGK